ncbi:MAG: DUF547 domain-containing protein [Syntrophobacterales bacterium]
MAKLLRISGWVILFWTVFLSGLVGPAVAEASSYDDYGAVLQEFVNQEGLVNYRGLKADPQKLENFLHALAQVHPEDYKKWPVPQQIAFWINAYNALTLKAIIDHYPIKASFWRSLKFPRNSIRQIPGVWTDLRFPVMGRRMTLDEIEHGILRRQFNEPRIHMALVCAALGCPPLRPEPYVGDKLNDQLNDQARHFLANPKKFKIDRQEGQVYLSPIFKWFGEDFIRIYGTNARFSRFQPKERAVLNFIQNYLSKADQEYLFKGDYVISYLDYDWSLNERPDQ